MYKVPAIKLILLSFLAVLMLLGAGALTVHAQGVTEVNPLALSPDEVSLSGLAKQRVGTVTLYPLKGYALMERGTLRLEGGWVTLKFRSYVVRFPYQASGRGSGKYLTFSLNGVSYPFSKTARLIGGSLYFDLESVLKAIGYRIALDNQGETVAYRPAGNYKADTVYWVPPNPNADFYYGYYFYMPSGVQRRSFALIEPNNISRKQVPYATVQESAKGTCEWVASQYGIPLRLPVLVPAFVGTDDINTITSYYPHALNRIAILETRLEFKRFDLQLLAMHQDLSQRLRGEGVILSNQVVLTGFSDSGNFVDRFTFIHPERVKVAVAGGHNLLALPTDRWQSQALNYPSGTADYAAIFGRDFDLQAYNAVHKLHYRANDDDKDPIYGTNHTPKDEKELVLSLFGGWQQRVQRYQAALEQLGAKNLQFNYYDGIGHTIPEQVRADIVRFIGANLGPDFVKTEHYTYSPEELAFRQRILGRFKVLQLGASRENSEALRELFGSGSGTSAINLSDAMLREKNVDLVIVWNDGIQALSDYIRERARALGFEGIPGTYVGWLDGRLWIYLESKPGAALESILDKGKILDALAGK